MSYEIYEGIVNLLGFVVFTMLVFGVIGLGAYILDRLLPEDKD